MSIMEKKNEKIVKLAQTAILAGLCYVTFTYLQIKIPMPGGDATSLHIGNAFCVLGALLLGGWYGGLAGAIGMTLADMMDPIVGFLYNAVRPVLLRSGLLIRTRKARPI